MKVKRKEMDTERLSSSVADPRSVPLKVKTKSSGHLTGDQSQIKTHPLVPDESRKKKVLQ